MPRNGAAARSVLPNSRKARSEDTAGRTVTEVIQGIGNVGMIGAQRLLEDRQGAPQERLGFCDVALLLVERGRVVQATRDVWMVGTVHLLSGGQGSAPPRDRSLPVCRPRFLASPSLADGQEWSTARIARSEGGDAGLAAGRHFAATGTAIPGIFTLTAPRWLRLVM